jgi:hypothetical protein
MSFIVRRPGGSSRAAAGPIGRFAYRYLFSHFFRFQGEGWLYAFRRRLAVVRKCFFRIVMLGTPCSVALISNTGSLHLMSLAALAERRWTNPCRRLRIERPGAADRRRFRECLHLWWGPWSSKPAEGLNKALSGFDSHTLPLAILSRGPKQAGPVVPGTTPDPEGGRLGRDAAGELTASSPNMPATQAPIGR